MTRPIAARDVAIAFSLANISYARLWAELFCATSPSESYYLKVANVDYLAASLNVLLLGSIFLAATAAARHFGGTRGRPLVAAGFVAVLALQLNFMGPKHQPGILAVLEWWERGDRLHPIAVVLALACVVAAGIRWRERVLSLLTGAVFIFWPFLLVTFGRAAWTVATVDPTEAFASRAPSIDAPVTEVEGPRVVILVLDAMGRRLAFENRPEGFTMPELDRLRAESIDATRVTQAGPRTRYALPALLSEVVPNESEPSGRDELALTVGERTLPWTEQRNLFDEARSLGGAAVVSGWYHPYCRIFEELSACSWYPSGSGAHGQDMGLLAAMFHQQQSAIPYVNRPLRLIDLHLRQVEDAKTAVVKGRKGLVFVHLAMPHRPWIWDVEEDEFTVLQFDDEDGHWDNLELADRTVGELRRSMEAAGKWRDTAVLVTSDHIFSRPKRMKDPPGDRRVPYLLKMPGQESGLAYDRPLGAVVTHDLVTALLRGELTTPDEAVAWLDGRADATPDVAATP